MGKFFKQLKQDENAVKEDGKKPHFNVLRSPSPSLNYVFANGHGLPFGYSAILFGPPKGGKSIICNAIIGQLHKDDPEACAIKYNTEMREEGQSSPIWGIDNSRYVAFNVNRPALIFDHIENAVQDLIQKGEKIKLIIIDSMQGIQGRMSQSSESVEDIRPGDKAYTQQYGLERILPIIRKYDIALLMTQHIRANLDMGGRGYGPKTKMAGAFGLKHAAEYYVEVSPNRSAEGKKDFEGTPLEDTTTRDVKGNKDITGKRIFVRMTASSVGVEGRTGEFLLDFHRGIVDTWAEVAQVGISAGIVFHPTSKSGTGVDNKRWQFGEEVWHGKHNFFIAVRDDIELQERILRAARDKDLAHLLPKK